VGFLSVQGEDLERDLGIRHEQRGDGPRTELAQRLQAMISVRRPVAAFLTDDDDRIEESSELFHYVHQALDVRE
jgi:hypothetical protein